MPDTAELLRPGSPSHAGNALTEQRNLRFAVGTFATWQQLRLTLHDLRLRGQALDSFNCLALKSVFAGKTIIAPSQQRVGIQELAFPGNPELFGCTSGPLADRLTERLQSGAPSLEDALGLWLVPRHAAHYEEAVEGGKILLWIRLVDADNERCAYQSLLANSADSVGVHDLLPSP